MFEEKIIHGCITKFYFEKRKVYENWIRTIC